MARRSNVTAMTLTGPLVLTEADVANSFMIAIDPGGAVRNVDLPATSAALKGQTFVIINTSGGAFALTVRLTGGGATVATIGQSQNATFYCWSATAGSWQGSVGKAA